MGWVGGWLGGWDAKNPPADGSKGGAMFLCLNTVFFAIGGIYCMTFHDT